MSEAELTSATDGSPRDEPLAQGSKHPRRRLTGWSCFLLFVGLCVLAWRGYSQRDYWRDVWQQKTIFPSYITPNQLNKNLD
jgi:type VI protein secretion system component VasF